MERSPILQIFQQRTIDEFDHVISFCHYGDVESLSRFGHENGLPLLVQACLDELKCLHFQIMQAAAANDVAALHRLLHRGVPPSIVVADFGLTPLAVATMQGNYEAVLRLLDHGANAHWTDDSGQTALTMARTRRQNPGPHVEPQLLQAHFDRFESIERIILQYMQQGLVPENGQDDESDNEEGQTEGNDNGGERNDNGDYGNDGGEDEGAQHDGEMEVMLSDDGDDGDY